MTPRYFAFLYLTFASVGCAWATRTADPACQAQMNRCTAHCAPTPSQVRDAQLTPKGGSQTMSPCEQACYSSCR